MESLKKKMRMRMEMDILYLCSLSSFFFALLQKKKKLYLFFFSLFLWFFSLVSISHSHSLTRFLSLSLSLCVWDIFIKFEIFRSIKKYLGWCKNVVHQTYYYFLPFGCWVSILLLGFDLHVRWWFGFFFFFFFFLCVFVCQENLWVWRLRFALLEIWIWGLVRIWV